MKIFFYSNFILVLFFINTHNSVYKLVAPQSETTHKIGEHFGGGIIFYVDSSGKHGLIASATDQKKVKWYNGSYVLTEATGIAKGSGQENTISIITSQGSGSYAATECTQLKLNGFNDWFLPSKDELDLLRQRKALVGGFNNAYYWCSTEYNSHYAWAQNFNTGFQNYGNKNSTPAVRAIRAF